MGGGGAPEQGDHLEEYITSGFVGQLAGLLSAEEGAARGHNSGKRELVAMQVPYTLLFEPSLDAVSVRSDVTSSSFCTLVTGPRRSLRLELSDTIVYEPQIRARLGNHNTTIRRSDVIS